MPSFQSILEFHTENKDSLCTILNCFRFIQRLNEDTSNKLNDFLPSLSVKENNGTLSKCIEKLMLFIKNKSILHIEIAE